MLILLPPSEGKNDAPAGATPLDLPSLAFPQLTAQREELIKRLHELTRIDVTKAVTALGLGVSQRDEVLRNAGLLERPAAPAAEIYSGVLYERLELATLPPVARRRADEQILIQSALWGVVGPADRIPAYRLAIGAKLPGLGGLAAFWRRPLAEALPADAFVVDLRSGAYAAAWRPVDGLQLAVRALVERDGRRSVVSHMAKATRGDVARILVRARRRAKGPEGVAEIVAAAGLRVELVELEKPAGAWRLDVVTTPAG